MISHRQAVKKTGLGCQASTASLLATAAGLGALLAVLYVGGVLFALIAAGFADFGAFLQQVGGVFGATGHETGREGADVGAVAVEADAADHHFYVLLAKAGGGAMLAGGDAGIERIKEGLVLGMHGKGC